MIKIAHESPKSIFQTIQRHTDYDYALVHLFEEDQEYLKLRERFLTQNHLCQIAVSGCTNGATDVHHTYAGANRDAFYLVQSTWLAVCRNCHDWVHNHPKESRALGYLK